MFVGWTLFATKGWFKSASVTLFTMGLLLGFVFWLVLYEVIAELLRISPWLLTRQLFVFEINVWLWFETTWALDANELFLSSSSLEISPWETSFLDVSLFSLVKASDLAWTGTCCKWAVFAGKPWMLTFVFLAGTYWLGFGLYTFLLGPSWFLIEIFGWI